MPASRRGANRETTEMTTTPANLIASIAAEHLRIETLETRNSDSADFHEVAVWNVKAALEAAYQAGRAAASPQIAREVEVDTRRYRMSHLREPRGRGGWLFETHDGEILGNFNGTYGEAKRAAQLAAATRGITLIYTCP